MALSNITINIRVTYKAGNFLTNSLFHLMCVGACIIVITEE